MHAAINLLMMNRPLIFRTFGSPVDAVWGMGLLALAAGGCAIAAGLWSAGKDHSWLLSVHGLALGAFGVIVLSPLVKGPLSFRPVSLIFTVMAATLGVFALLVARGQRRGAAERWFPIAAGAASIGFALSFVAVGFQIIRLVPPNAFFIWMSSYFGFCSMFMLWLAFRVHRQSVSQGTPAAPLSSVPSPRHAH
jgi:uncharacterized membrane protein HdeD (DUF308 family)